MGQNKKKVRRAFVFTHYKCERFPGFPRWPLRRPQLRVAAYTCLQLLEYNRLEQKASLVDSDFFHSLDRLRNRLLELIKRLTKGGTPRAEMQLAECST